MKSFAKSVREELENIEGEKLHCEMAQAMGFRLFAKDNHDTRARIDFDILKEGCCKRAFLRGAFLASGYVIDPRKNYHLEFLVPFAKLRKDFTELLEWFGLPTKCVKKNIEYSFYFKDSEIIADILGLMGANKSMLEYMNVKIENEDSGNLNRRINVETANYDRAIIASSKAIEAINRVGIENLPEKLREIARARRENPTMSMGELAAGLGMTKSRVYQGLRKIINYKLQITNDG